VAPVITGGATAGSTGVSGQGSPNVPNGQLEICAGAALPCTVLGTGGTNSVGFFAITLNRPLVVGESIFAFDLQHQIAGPVVVVRAATAAPALTPWGMAGLVVALFALGLVGLRRPLWRA
jgi:hypothetical protein